MKFLAAICPNQKVVFYAKGQVLDGSSASLPTTNKRLYSETWSKFKLAMHAAKHVSRK